MCNQLGDGEAAQPSLTRPHAAAQESFHLVRSVAAKGDSIDDLPGSYLLAPAYDRIPDRAAKLRHRLIVCIEKCPPAHHTLETRTNRGLVWPHATECLGSQGLDGREASDLATDLRGFGACNAGPISRDGYPGDCAIAGRVEDRRPTQLHCVPTMLDTDRHREINVWNDTLMQEDRVHRQTLLGSGGRAVYDAFNVSAAFNAKFDHIADHAHAAPNGKQEPQTLREVG